MNNLNEALSIKRGVLEHLAGDDVEISEIAQIRTCSFERKNKSTKQDVTPRSS